MKLVYSVIILFSSALHSPLFAQAGRDSVVVLPLKMAAPVNAKKAGSIKAGNNATETHCDYEEVIAEAKEKARAMGGNVVKITALIQPTFISKCYSIKADVYYASDPPNYKPTPVTEAGKNYATLYIYRLKDSLLLEPSYSLHLNNDSVICFIKNKSAEAVKIYKEGVQTFWAKTGQREELKLEVKFGAVYYIRCGLKGGEFRKVPVIEQVDEKTGIAEYPKKKAKKDQGVKYLQEIH